MHPLAVVLQTNGTAVDRAREYLESLATTEGRLAVSAGLVLLTILIGVVIAPRIVRSLTVRLHERLGTGRYSTAVTVAGDYVPTTLGDILLRLIQIGLLLIAIVALLVVWGLAETAVDILNFVGVTLPLVGKLATTLGLFLAAYIAVDLLDEAVSRFSEGADRVTEHQEEIVLRLAHLSVLVFAISGALTIWGWNLSGLLVGAGFLGIVVGFAARQTLGSLIAGFVLMFSRPFTIGDWVEIGDEEGIVTDITIVNTRLENFDGEFVVIPNDIVGNQPITNRSQKGHLRLRQDVGIDYDADPDHAMDVALEAMGDVEAIEKTPPPQVIPKAFGDSAVVLELRFWIDRPTPPRKWQATSAVVRAVKAAFEEAGIKIPFPQRELTGRAETAGFRVNDWPAEADDQIVEHPGSVRAATAAGDDSATDGDPDSETPDEGDGEGDDENDPEDVGRPEGNGTESESDDGDAREAGGGSRTRSDDR